MKMVIDIPDNDYKFIKDLQSLIIGGRGNCKTIQKNVINAIRNGTPYNPSGDLISREALKKHKVYSHERHEYVVPVYNIDNAPTVSPERPQGECEKCDYRKFTETFIDGIVDVISKNGIADFDEFAKRCGDSYLHQESITKSDTQI